MAAAAALADRGLRVVSLGPAGDGEWPAEYGIWADELEALGLGAMIENRWPRTVVAFGEEREVLSRAYARVDKGRLAAWLRARCEAGSVRWVDGTASDATHDASGSTIRCRDGGEVRARLVIDASGHRPALVRFPGAPPQGYQTAFGLTLRAEDALPAREAMLMDWSDVHLPAELRAGPPSFLYALPLGAGRVFVEETVLVARPAVAPELLEQRLLRRLAALGIRGERLGGPERVWIPMGGALPHPAQRTVGFGGAARMVHPATGYLLPRVLGSAAALADAAADALGRAGPEHAARAAWGSLWPADRRRRHALFSFGMEALLGLDASGMREFFGAFFRLPEDDWAGYLGDRLAAGELAALMGRLFLRAPRPVRWRLARLGAGPQGIRLAGCLLRAAG